MTKVSHKDEFWVDPRRAITKAYEKTDQTILSNSSNLGRGGSTAVTAILINGLRLWVANVGDSRAVLSRGGQAIQMTIDHEPNTERDSIEGRGGFVSNMPGDVARVNGQLAVSRAFGDKSLKSHLRSDPDILDIYVDVNCDILILASDGLWKVMSNQEAIDVARRFKDPKKAAKQLTAEALKRDSKDDISCVVIRFRFFTMVKLRFGANWGQCLGGESSSSSGRGRSHEGNIKYGFSLAKGKADHPMEDYHVAKFVQIEEHELGCFQRLGRVVRGFVPKNGFCSSEKPDVFCIDDFAAFLSGDVARVNGKLAVSRAFGDKNCKSHLRSDPDIHDVYVDVNSDILILTQ
ncbi:hypothetical protein HAX54_028319 [Datura stramonium]|uniref:PPM-type phosphatase domain-containing protein n=1 Tax=Datura stramonium TaxID=4076 RepID=A0ABS8S9J7_DATST|nr:hypothetical protein [Datura stramonium]